MPVSSIPIPPFPHPDPVAFFPPEISTKILRMAMQPDLESAASGGMPSAFLWEQDIRPLLRVSHAWRAVSRPMQFDEVRFASRADLDRFLRQMARDTSVGSQVRRVAVEYYVSDAGYHVTDAEEQFRVNAEALEMVAARCPGAVPFFPLVSFGDCWWNATCFRPLWHLGEFQREGSGESPRAIGDFAELLAYALNLLSFR